MRLRTLLVSLCVYAVTAVPVEQTAEARFAKTNVLNTLLQSLPSRSRMILEARLQNASPALKSKLGLSDLNKRQSDPVTVALLGSLLNEVQLWNTPRPTSPVPEVQTSKSPLLNGATRHKIRYGPYRIPPTSEKNLESQLTHTSGLTDTIKVNAKKPCTGDCILLRLGASLEYADGTVAKQANGAWLHHAVVLNFGFQVRDAVCPDGLQGYMEHLFETGNERTDIDFTLQNSSIKSGYHLRAGDTFLINTELMNMEDKEKWTWLTLTYDVIDGFPAEYKEGKVVWTSIGPPRCSGVPDVNPFGQTNLTKSQQPVRTVFTEYSIPWVSRKNGWIMGSNGHMHDGGTSTEVFKNDQRICISYPHYSMGGHGMGGMGHDKRQLRAGNHTNTDIEHIDVQEGCFYTDPVPIKKGDSLYIRANYDFTAHAGMKNKKGELDEVMGIVGSLIAFDYPY
ncbi:hypothetical protein EJ06DRAFT_557869 [Trichodelitschia bisporula]|uniref:Uncharacterized protein n=1 Tax=Trichodelitschia bisporula TaxID=703511 RepID=A0A6G1HSE0_9PEZI|nr:hypothetical protein EJ06DRAFT_557869 [Trichodelitschia bisporula]